MNNPAEKLVATAQTSMAGAQELATKAQATAEKLVELNLSTAKTALSDTMEHAQSLMGAKDPQAFAALQAGLAKPAAAKAMAYAQEFQKIVADASAEFNKAAQANMENVQKGFAELMGSANNTAPAGTESAMAFFTNALTASQNAFATAQTTAKQAVEAAQANFSTMTAQAVDAVKKASKPS